MVAMPILRHPVSISGLTDTMNAVIVSTMLEDALEMVTVRLEFLTTDPPPVIRLSWEHPVVDIHNRWYPTTGWDRGQMVDWGNGYTSRATSGAPVCCLYNASGRNRLTFAFSDALNPVKI